MYLYKCFSKVTDITSTLEVIIYDEKKSEEVGAISIPLLKIRPGKKWFALKDSALKEKAKGNNPRILLEMNVTWNLVSTRTYLFIEKKHCLLTEFERYCKNVFYQLHSASIMQQGRQRGLSVMTLRSTLSAEFRRNCVLSGGTQHCALSQHQSEEM